MNRLIIQQKTPLRIMSFECRKAHSNPPFFRQEIIELPDKILIENCLFISKYINFNLPPEKLFFRLTYETSSSSKGLLMVKTVNTKKHSREEKP